MAAGIKRKDVMNRVTREKLVAYRSMKEEIAELTYKLNHLSEEDGMIGSSVIKDYRSGYPVPQAVVGVDWKRYDKLKDRYEHRIHELEKECTEIEEFIERISDSMARRIFRMYYIEGRSQREIGKAVHLDKSNVSRKIENFLKSQRTQQTQRYNNT